MTAAGALTDHDVAAVREQAATDKPVTVWFTPAAVGVPVGGSAKVVAVGDSAEGDFIQVRPAGSRDTMFCSPHELTRARPARRGAARGADKAEKPATPTGPRASTSTGRSAPPPAEKAARAVDAQVPGTPTPQAVVPPGGSAAAPGCSRVRAGGRAADRPFGRDQRQPESNGGRRVDGRGTPRQGDGRRPRAGARARRRRGGAVVASCCRGRDRVRRGECASTATRSGRAVACRARHRAADP